MTLLRWLILPVLMSALWTSSGDSEGRRGNTLYERGAFAEAEAAFQAGIAQTDPRDSTRYAALHHNWAAALYQQEAYAQADSVFAVAQEYARDTVERVRIRYNRATNAARTGDTETALAHYRAALLLDPAHDDARHNYEVLARQQAAAPAPRPAPDIDPSDYAQRLKRRAEALAAQREYATAFELLQDGLAEDSTVAAYQDFMGRLGAIVAIDQDSVSTVRRP
ncbi:hypothetical protein CRI93_04920 [Longimonas halophila]|uniref:Uncharacterized protein n=1 Tax=Longimonas halophila TaxID=1469170 RepID=A0A2H3NV45_9BACT|nr:hypothetical protein [Longimonas halophila]PEN08457.1 hypothetical protein CRI93_04920 [Longimonas halophila]